MAVFVGREVTQQLASPLYFSLFRCLQRFFLFVRLLGSSRILQQLDSNLQIATHTVAPSQVCTSLDNRFDDVWNFLEATNSLCAVTRTALSLSTNSHPDLLNWINELPYLFSGGGLFVVNCRISQMCEYGAIEKCCIKHEERHCGGLSRLRPLKAFTGESRLQFSKRKVCHFFVCVYYTHTQILSLSLRTGNVTFLRVKVLGNSFEPRTKELWRQSQSSSSIKSFSIAFLSRCTSSSHSKERENPKSTK